jgi:hypothetical protein
MLSRREERNYIPGRAVEAVSRQRMADIVER